ncbi:MAG: hypothetical protein ACREF3_14990, partial [Acetobacteraceae bacterium]
RGSVSLYQGEELGLTEAELEAEHLRDPFGIAYWPEFRGRDGSRTPIPWQAAAPHGGFTTAPQPWLPVPEAHYALAVDRLEEDQGALLHAFRRFLAWRSTHPALIHGSFHPLDLPEPFVGFIRADASDRIAAIFNLGDAPAVFDAGGLGGIRPLPESGFAAELDGRDICLQAYAAFFGALESVSGDETRALATA